MNELALFAGAGGGLLATKWLLNWRSVCYVERDPYCIEVLKARIRDGYLDDAPIWDDVRTFDGRPWAGLVDVVTGGFPCQPFAAHWRRMGAQDERNAWPDTIRIIREVQPEWVFLENSPKLLAPFPKIGLTAYIGRVIGELAESGYVGKWDCIPASTFGLHHQRNRIWIVAHASIQRRPFVLRHEKTISRKANESTPEKTASLDDVWNRLSQLEERLGEPSVFGTNDGMAHRVDRLAAVGQGQVPIVAATAWKLLTEEL